MGSSLWGIFCCTARIVCWSACTALCVVIPAGEQYGPWFLYGLFAAILVWEEVWDLPHTAALSGWLLILITAGAVVCRCVQGKCGDVVNTSVHIYSPLAPLSAIFERRYWCRWGEKVREGVREGLNVVCLH